jgi:hypothetical protein
MGVPSKIAIGIVSAWIGLHVNPAAAQNFNERWSIIPKANAAEPEGQLKPVPQTRPSAGAEAASPPASTAGSARARRSVRKSLPQAGLQRKGLILFVQERENSERFVVQTQFVNRSPSEPAIRHEGSRDRCCEQEVGDSYHHRPRAEDSWPRARPFARRRTQLGDHGSWRGPRSR